MTKREYESQVQLLVGHRLNAVRYHEILYTDENGVPLADPEWSRNHKFDSLDYGVDLEFLDGSICHITWDIEFEQYGVSLKWQPQRNVAAIRVWDVTRESRWQSLVGQRITVADVYWSWIQYEGDPDRIDYPQTLRLSFENGVEVYISAFEIRHNDFRMGGMDHITVFFDAAIAKHCGAWPSSTPPMSA